MALLKEIRRNNGVTTNYHRILYLDIVTNNHNSIVVASYIDEKSRSDEKENFENQQYTFIKTYETQYNEEMTIKLAYEFLKTLPDFSGSVDI